MATVFSEFAEVFSEVNQNTLRRSSRAAAHNGEKAGARIQSRLDRTEALLEAMKLDVPDLPRVTEVADACTFSASPL
jgi:hypothetical protein